METRRSESPTFSSQDPLQLDIERCWRSLLGRDFDFEGIPRSPLIEVSGAKPETRMGNRRANFPANSSGQAEQALAPQHLDRGQDSLWDAAIPAACAAYVLCPEAMPGVERETALALVGGQC
jgi:hypothetical protein